MVLPLPWHLNHDLKSPGGLALPESRHFILQNIFTFLTIQGYFYVTTENLKNETKKMILADKCIQTPLLNLSS